MSNIESTAILQDKEKSAESVKETVTQELYSESWEIITQELHQLVSLSSSRDVEFSWQRSTRTEGSKEISPDSQAAWVWVCEVLILWGVDVTTNQHIKLIGLVDMQHITRQFSDQLSKENLNKEVIVF